jgi:hypothetical protein
MTPPQTLSVLKDNGFTAVIPKRSCERETRRQRLAKRLAKPDKYMIDPVVEFMRNSDTLWRPASVLGQREVEGTLVGYHEHSFFQNDNNVTFALYRVPRYGYLLGVWFRNSDGTRIV